MLVISVETPKKHIFYIRGTRLEFKKNTYEWLTAQETVKSSLMNYMTYLSGVDTTVVTSDMGTVDFFAKEYALKLNKKIMVYKTDLSIEFINESGAVKKLSRKIECSDNNALSAINKTIRADLGKDGLEVYGCWIGFTKSPVNDLTKMYIAPEQVKIVHNFALMNT